ncbi:SET domain-containing protein-lysine N-methyltransferase [Endozoicomonas arenosclerae]|uniref:SET domain-containing protein-lysine N-methyltransferase n=1 Tax=Endozoicomonas arenosclerae TaxID=1633495 RepID=UPI000B1CD962|nr:SET domain-containing protein [Endozoicomonas arenosclerae]
MFCVETYLAQSPVHGVGLFAGQSIKKGVILYKENPELDLHLSEQALLQLEASEQAFIKHYGFFDVTRNRWHLSHDNIRFCNHSKQGNISLVEDGRLIALRDIDSGEELLQDYREIKTYEGRNLKD